MKHGPRSDATVNASAYLRQTIPSQILSDEDRERAINVLIDSIKKQVADLVFYAVRGHWVFRVRGPSASIDGLATFVKATKGLELIRDNPPTDSTDEGTPESADPIEHK